MRLTRRIALAVLAFTAAVWLPDLANSGLSGTSTDLGLGRLLSQGSVLAFAIAFAGGVLTSLTPCVYPLIPITVSIFGAKRSVARSQAIALSGLYVLGIATMYSALGAGAAFTGKAFGSATRSPWVLSGVALFFAVMALSMFGAFELRLPASLQGRLSKVGGAGRAGSFAMGLVAGVVAAPCTGPVLAAALTYIATRGSVVFGLGIMFAYAIGMGLLFFLIGAFSVSLPKSGPWMETVKGLFGVALLAAAGVFLEDAIPAVRPLFLASRSAALAAASAVAVGVLLGAIQASFSGPTLQRLGKVVGLVLAVGGIIYAVGAAGARERAVAAPLPWLHDEQEALTIARTQGRPMIIDFWADWCAACKELDQTAWADPRIREAARGFVALKVDGTTDSPAFEATLQKYGVVGMPTVIFIDAHGRELPARITGAISGAEMLQWLRAVDQACATPALACAARW